MTYDEMRIRQAWGRVLDYLSIEWEGLPGALPGQVTLEDLM